MKMKMLQKIQTKWNEKKKEKLAKKSEQERLEQKREEVLARGNKFRYPLQFSKHRVMVMTVIIAVVAVTSMSGALVFGLYHGQDSSEMMYKIVKILPFAVGEVEGEKVRYSDYLLLYRSSIVPVEKQTGQFGSGSKDAEAMRAYYKRSALDGAEDLTYALRLAKEKNITVGADQMAKNWEEQKNVGGITRSEASFLQVLWDNFGLTKSEYERMMYLNLTKTEVMKNIDTKATETVEKAEEILRNGGNLQKIADELKEEVEYEETGGMVDVMNVDGGRAKMAMKTEKDKISEKFLSSNGDGYYFVKTIKKDEKQVDYASIKVPFREFERLTKELRTRGAVKEYIKI